MILLFFPRSIACIHANMYMEDIEWFKRFKYNENMYRNYSSAQLDISRNS